MPTFTSGEFSAQVGSRMQSGTWYAIDLGSLDLFFAGTSDTDGGIIVTGLATPGSIFGCINGMSSSSLKAGWFIGTSSGLPAEPNASSGTIGSGGEAD